MGLLRARDHVPTALPEAVARGAELAGQNGKARGQDALLVRHRLPRVQGEVHALLLGRVLRSLRGAAVAVLGSLGTHFGVDSPRQPNTLTGRLRAPDVESDCLLFSAI